MDTSHHQAKHGFGIDKDKVVSELRNTADLIEKGEIIVKELSYTLKSAEDNYRSDILTFTFVSPVDKL